jgi:hypothetical protein
VLSRFVRVVSSRMSCTVENRGIAPQSRVNSVTA